MKKDGTNGTSAVRAATAHDNAADSSGGQDKNKFSATLKESTNSPADSAGRRYFVRFISGFNAIAPTTEITAAVIAEDSTCDKTEPSVPNADVQIAHVATRKIPPEILIAATAVVFPEE